VGLTIDGGEGDDIVKLLVGSISVNITGGAGNDAFFGYNQNLNGTVAGGDGNDVFVGLGSSGDYLPQLLGDAGDDRFVVGAFIPPQIDGGAGNDVLVVEDMAAPTWFS